MDLLIKAILVTLGIIVGLTFGRARERAHYRSIVERERKLGYLPIRTEEHPNVDGFTQAKMVSGTVVIANDYFKSTVASVKTLFGGRLTSYESLMDRARREAVLRAQEAAAAWGATELLNLRVESSSIDEYGVEVFAFGTAVKR